MITLALVGNPNCGKTTLFNQLTGTTAYVGNWPGVTVEKKEGIYRGMRILDLPGIYSLSPYSPEEKVARRYILDEQPDLIIDVIDSTNLERSLYLTTQLVELGRPVILALNMTDLLEKNGITIDAKKLSMLFNCPAIQLSASKNQGLENFDEIIHQTLDSRKLPACPLFSNTVEQYITPIIADDYLHNLPQGRPMRWAAIKLIEQDELFLSSMPPIPPSTKKLIDQACAALTVTYDDDPEAVLIDQRYKVAEKIRSACQTSIKKEERFSLDKIATSKYGAIPLFALVMAGVFYFSIQLVGGITTPLIERFFSFVTTHLGAYLSSIGVIPILNGLLVNGIIGGVGSVLTFVPQLFVLFLLLSILEDCGYMARIAFIMDRIMRSIGLSGKSIIPLVIGTGCSVPAIMCSRTIEHQRERELTVIVTPFIPCGAKMPTFALFISFFFPGRWYIAPLIYFLGILSVIITGLVSQKLDRHKETNAFILELPHYQVPTAKNVWLQTKERISGFIHKAGTIILLAAAGIYVLQSFSFTLQPVTPDASILATVGRFLSPIFKPIGFGYWQATVALLTGIAAKESIVSTLTVTLGGAALSTIFTTRSALAFMTFVLLSTPCIAAQSAMYKELGSNKKKFWKAVGYQMGFAYLLAFVIYLVA